MMTPQDLMDEILRALQIDSEYDRARECYYIATNYAREQREAETERLMGSAFADRAYGRERQA